MVQRKSYSVVLWQLYYTKKNLPGIRTHKSTTTLKKEDTFQKVLSHQIRPVSDIPELQWTTAKRCLICKDRKRTACTSCKQPYYFKCGIIIRRKSYRQASGIQIQVELNKLVQQTHQHRQPFPFHNIHSQKVTETVTVKVNPCRLCNI